MISSSALGQGPTQRQRDSERTEAWKSPQTEEGTQRQERGCYPNAGRTGTWRAIEEFIRRDSCLQAIAAGVVFQGQVLAPDPGPGASTDPTTAMEAGFTRVDIKQELLNVLGHRQSLGPGEGATSSPRGRIVRSHNRDPPTHAVQRREEARKLFQATGQRKVFTEKRPLPLPLVGVKPSPAAEGGAKFEVNWG